MNGIDPQVVGGAIVGLLGLIGTVLGLRSQQQTKRAELRVQSDIQLRELQSAEVRDLREEVRSLRERIQSYDSRYQSLLQDISGLRVAFTEMEVGVTTLIHQLEQNGIEPAWRPDSKELRRILPWVEGDRE